MTFPGPWPETLQGTVCRPNSARNLTHENNTRAIFRAFFVAAGFAFVATACFALQFRGDVHTILYVLATSVAIAGASVTVGALLGFIFGVPRLLQSDDLDKGQLRILSNSNLEQISDWLTKILVGVGLVQIQNVPSALAQLGAILEPGLGSASSSAAFGVSTTLYCFVIGFVLMYMWTRTRFLEVLNHYAVELNKPNEAPPQTARGG